MARRSRSCSAAPKAPSKELQLRLVIVGRDCTGQYVDELDLSAPDVFLCEDLPPDELAAFAAEWIERQLKALSESSGAAR
jgi:hypothetical protein